MANDAIASFGLDGTILTVNRSTEELYRISAADVIGQNLFRPARRAPAAALR